MPRIDNKKFYNASLLKHKNRAAQVHWNSKESQYIRFEILRSLLPTSLSGLSIVDAGCGLGEFYFFLQDGTTFPKNYIGLDIHHKMVEIAKKETRCDIFQCDILKDPLPIADYYLCSGGMNILTRFETYTFIQRAYEHSNRGFIFNLLRGKDESETYNYFLPKDIKKLADQLNAEYEIVEGYMPLDFSVAFYKKG